VAVCRPHSHTRQRGEGFLKVAIPESEPTLHLESPWWGVLWPCAFPTPEQDNAERVSSNPHFQSLT